MSERLTTEYMPTNEGAFGPKGKQGDIGEACAADLFDLLGFTYKWHKVDVDKQNAGKDFELLINGEWIGIDIKANIHNDGNKKVCVDYIKMKSPRMKARYWLHINVEDHLNDFIVYPIQSMIETARAFPPTREGLRWVWKDIAESLKEVELTDR